MARRTARPARAAAQLAAVERIERAVAGQRLRAEQCGASRAVAHLAAGRPFITAPNPTRPERLPPMSLSAAVQSAAIASMWRATSQTALLVDATLTEELLRSTSDALPTTVLRRLPYINPLVVFAEPVPSHAVDGRPSQLLGFFVDGAWGTHDRLDALGSSLEAPIVGAMMVSEVCDGSTVTHEIHRLALPVTADRVTITDLITETIKHIAIHTVDDSEPAAAPTRQCLTHHLQVAVNTLLYLCAEDPDIQPIGPTKPKSNRASTNNGKRRSRATEVVHVGWRIGAHLRLLRRRATEAQPGSNRGGWKHPPRQRKGHWRIVWTGSGRETSKLKWIAPYWIHRDQLGLPTTKSTLVPVKS
ncbi:hypothetical protein [Nocardia sp. NPDC052566]|uniref:hypothetical protein n=1 Tax=Nocardia sp. NPDC052566 TaxID=3364330 RepID=UPI0037C4F5D7